MHGLTTFCLLFLLSCSIGSLVALSFITAFYGLFFAMPLRKYYILKQKLTFPSPTATAFTIRNLHSATTLSARKAASKKIKILGYSFFLSLAWTVLTKCVSLSDLSISFEEQKRRKKADMTLTFDLFIILFFISDTPLVCCGSGTLDGSLSAGELPEQLRESSLD